jgi:hypothetical protein
MKISTKMPIKLIPFYETELSNAKVSFQNNELAISWNHLERAHILAQPYPIEHTAVHWKMLLFGIKIKNSKEVFGQIPRLLVGGVKSFVDKIPIGNTGGTNVSPLKVMEIPNDLKEIINNTKN